MLLALSAIQLVEIYKFLIRYDLNRHATPGPQKAENFLRMFVLNPKHPTLSSNVGKNPSAKSRVLGERQRVNCHRRSISGNKAPLQGHLPSLLAQISA